MKEIIKNKKENPRYLKQVAGFTVAELLIVMGVLVVLIAAVIPIYGSLQVLAQLNENTSQIIQTLRIARERGIARYNDSQHGVYFEVNESGYDRYILYQGSSYALRNSQYDREMVLDKVLRLSLPEGRVNFDINFSKGLGLPNNPGTITLIHNTQGLARIVVNILGMVEEE